MSYLCERNRDSLAMASARQEKKPSNVMLGFDSVFESGDYKGMTVRSVLSIGRKSILFRLLSMGYQFDDEVLAYANIRKVIRKCESRLSVVEHSGSGVGEKLGTDIGTVDDIIDELGDDVPEIDEDTIPVDDSDNGEAEAPKKRTDSKFESVTDDEDEDEEENWEEDDDPLFTLEPDDESSDF